MAKKQKDPRSERRGFGRLRQFRSGRWKASYTHDGELYEAPNTFSARIDAEAWLTDRRREIDNDLWLPPPAADQRKKAAAAKKAAAVKFGDYAKQWLATRTVRGRELRPRTREHYEKLLENHIYPTFKNKPLRDITIAAVDKWYATTLPKNPTMRAHAYSLLRTILETARTRDRLIPDNPCLIRGAGTVRRAIKPKPATVEQLATITESMPEQYRAMVLLAYWCAMRFGELVELRRKDVDLDDEVVHVRRAAARVEGGWVEGDPKSDAGIRDVAIPPHLIEPLKCHLTKIGKGKDALLFPAKDTDKHLQPSTLYRHWYKARTKANRKDLRFHDLRHSGAVLAALTGATLAELMARLGHSTPAAAMRYQHAAQGRDKEIAALLSKMAQ